jgi:hypothetical protein
VTGETFSQRIFDPLVHRMSRTLICDALRPRAREEVTARRFC